MVEKTQILELKTKLSHLQNKLKKAQNSKLKFLYGINLLQKKIEITEQELWSKAAQFLIEQVSELKQLANENLELLKDRHSQFKFEVEQLSKRQPIRSGYFKGAITRDGFLHCEPSEDKWSAYAMSYKEFPEKLLGKIDFLGNVELKTIQIGTSAVYSMPVIFDGNIGKDGVITMNFANIKFITISPQLTIKAISGRILTPAEAEQFFSNSLILRNHIQAFIENL